MLPGGNPVTEVPGLTPKSPETTVGPVFVTAEPPKTAKLAAVPKSGAVPIAGIGELEPDTAKTSTVRGIKSRVKERILNIELSPKKHIAPAINGRDGGLIFICGRGKNYKNIRGELLRRGSRMQSSGHNPVWNIT
jgi:hypothetical protein